MYYWIKADSRPKCEKLFCSKCRQPAYTRFKKEGVYLYKYCPNCGVKIDGGIKEWQ